MHKEYTGVVDGMAEASAIARQSNGTQTVIAASAPNAPLLTRVELVMEDVADKNSVCFTVNGQPRAKGSWSAYARKDGRGVVFTQAQTITQWQRRVATVARQHRPASWDMAAPMQLEVVFSMPRPKRSKHELHVVKPDLDKLCRTICDALTGSLYDDDSQVFSISARKCYAALFPPGITIRLVAT